MKQFIITAMVLTVGLVLAGAVEAKGKPSGGNSQGSKSFSQGSKSQSYKCYSKGYCNWNSYCWNSKYGCCFYYCPSSCCYYYWYQPTCCYYPVSCLESYPPTKFASEQVQVTQITNVNVNGQQTNQEQVGPPVGSGPVVKSFAK